MNDDNTYLANTTATSVVAEEVIAEPEPVQSGLSSLVPFVLIFIVMYFLLIRPQEKKRKELETLVSGAKKGDKVITNSGIFGVITKLDDSDATVMIEIANGVEMKILKSSIADIPSQQEKKEAKKAKSKAVTKKKK